MHLINRTGRNPVGARKAAAVLTVLLLIALGLAACGSSGSSTTTTTSTTITSANAGGTPTTGSAGSGAGTVRGHRPSATAPHGSVPSAPNTPPPAPAGAGAGTNSALRACLASHHLTKASSAQISEAIKSCGALLAGESPNSSTARAHEKMKKFAACMRENGVNLPEPNVSGTGPIWDTKGINLHSPQYQEARGKCKGV